MAALRAVQRLEPRPRDRLAGQHAEDPAELRLGVARPLLLGADRRDLHQQIGGLGGGLGLLGHALVEIGEPVPRLVLLREAVELGDSLEDALRAAFDRFLGEDAARTDPSCRAKVAVLEALESVATRLGATEAAAR